MQTHTRLSSDDLISDPLGEGEGDATTAVALRSYGGKKKNVNSRKK